MTKGMRINLSAFCPFSYSLYIYSDSTIFCKQTNRKNGLVVLIINYECTIQYGENTHKLIGIEFK